ncbi:MAG: SDR family NAD(P)-dependent oxidoreductase [Clostridia bacterium]
MLKYFNTNWFKNKQVIITGVSSGIGRELARQLVSDFNCNILGIARNVTKLETLKEELGDHFVYHSMDVGSKEAWQEFAESDLVSFFSPDILINNAGIIHPFIRFLDLDEKEMERVINTNYLSLIYACRAMLPILEQSAHPALINVSSASALLPVAGASIYSSTKSAAYSLTDVLREELMGSGYYVACVLPGPVKTDLYSPHSGDGQSSKVADKDLFANAGISSSRAAKIILRKMSHRKNVITVGGIAKGMGWFKNYLPDSSIDITGAMLRALPIKTFQGLFINENVIRKERRRKHKQAKKNRNY